MLVCVLEATVDFILHAFSAHLIELDNFSNRERDEHNSENIEAKDVGISCFPAPKGQ